MNLLKDILSSRVRAEVFRLLFGLEHKELHLREMGRRSDLNIETVRQDLKKLVKFDLVKSRRDGNRVYYRANEVHPLYCDIRNLVLKTSGLIEVLRPAIGKNGVRAVFVFGSIATGTAGGGSDIDLMVIGQIGLRELSRRLAGAADQLGREINPHLFTPGEFRKRCRTKEHLVTSVLESPKMFVVGNEDDLAAMGQ